jgi:lysophospholipase L1-like esterase
MSFPSIILVGDSLTAQSFSADKDGFAASLAKDYVRKADVLNRGLGQRQPLSTRTEIPTGLSGYNTQWILPCLEEIVAARTSKVLLWIIMIGSNDACLPGYVHHVCIQAIASE